MGLSAIDNGIEDCIYVGNLDAKRDWGHAEDYVEIQWKMLQKETPEDYVIATGRQESVRKFIELSAIELGWGGINWEGEKLEEVGRRKDNNEIVIRIDKRYFRPSEVDSLLGDSTKAKKHLGWQPTKNLEQLIYEMIKNDREIASKRSLLIKHGYKINKINND